MSRACVELAQYLHLFGAQEKEQAEVGAKLVAG